MGTKLDLEESECPDSYFGLYSELIDTYGITTVHAGCYICNFEDDYICHQYNGGCSLLGLCRRIHELESRKTED